MELAGIKNGFGKQLGSGNPLNNARATVDGLLRQMTLQQAADKRDLTVEQLLGVASKFLVSLLSLLSHEDFPLLTMPWNFWGPVTEAGETRISSFCILMRYIPRNLQAHLQIWQNLSRALCQGFCSPCIGTQERAVRPALYCHHLAFRTCSLSLHLNYLNRSLYVMLTSNTFCAGWWHSKRSWRVLSQLFGIWGFSQYIDSSPECYLLLDSVWSASSCHICCNNELLLVLWTR